MKKLLMLLFVAGTFMLGACSSDYCADCEITRDSDGSVISSGEECFDSDEDQAVLDAAAWIIENTDTTQTASCGDLSN